LRFLSVNGTVANRTGPSGVADLMSNFDYPEVIDWPTRAG
jgi:hypothetical protein